MLYLFDYDWFGRILLVSELSLRVEYFEKGWAALLLGEFE